MTDERQSPASKDRRAFSIITIAIAFLISAVCAGGVLIFALGFGERS